jgi:AcrR family transcriptional regulator
MPAARGRPEVTEQDLGGERSQRIIAAMRQAVGEHGIAGATFERVAAIAGVSRGLLHYHFGSKERLLVEVVRDDVELRIQAFDRALAPAKTLEDVIAVMVASFEDMHANQRDLFGLIIELAAAGRHNDEIRRQIGEHYERSRRHLAELLRQKEREGVVSMRYQPDAVVSYLIASGDGLGVQILADPERNHSRAVATGAEVARYLLTSD